jgi:hypothetical protein
MKQLTDSQLNQTVLSKGLLDFSFPGVKSPKTPIRSRRRKTDLDETEKSGYQADRGK